MRYKYFLAAGAVFAIACEALFGNLSAPTMNIATLETASVPPVRSAMQHSIAVCQRAPGTVGLSRWRCSTDRK